MPAKSLEAVMLRNIRTRLGIHQKEMSRIFGVGENMIYLWENDKCQIRAATLIMIVEYYSLNFQVELNRARDEINRTSER